MLSEALLAEYRAVLLRPRLSKLHGLSETEIDVILVDIARHAIVMTPVRTTVTPLTSDPGDQFLWNLLTGRAELMLVAGDTFLLQDEVQATKTPCRHLAIPNRCWSTPSHPCHPPAFFRIQRLA